MFRLRSGRSEAARLFLENSEAPALLLEGRLREQERELEQCYQPSEHLIQRVRTLMVEPRFTELRRVWEEAVQKIQSLLGLEQAISLSVVVALIESGKAAAMTEVRHLADECPPTERAWRRRVGEVVEEQWQATNKEIEQTLKEYGPDIEGAAFFSVAIIAVAAIGAFMSGFWAIWLRGLLALVRTLLQSLLPALAALGLIDQAAQAAEEDVTPAAHAVWREYREKAEARIHQQIREAREQGELPPDGEALATEVWHELKPELEQALKETVRSRVEMLAEDRDFLGELVPPPEMRCPQNVSIVQGALERLRNARDDELEGACSHARIVSEGMADDIAALQQFYGEGCPRAERLLGELSDLVERRCP